VTGRPPAPDAVRARNLPGRLSNDDGKVNIADPLRLLGFLFGGQPDLPLPSNNTCGIDPTVDELDCLSFPPCAGP
jgi:hypothetical protein